MSEWKPIESAPKDSTAILIWDQGDVYKSWWDKDNNQWERHSGANWEPNILYWMPLPKEPCNHRCNIDKWTCDGEFRLIYHKNSYPIWSYRVHCCPFCGEYKDE